MEQLTLEQAIEAYMKERQIHPIHASNVIKDFKAGAEWRRDRYRTILDLAFAAANELNLCGAQALCDKIKTELELLQD